MVEAQDLCPSVSQYSQTDVHQLVQLRTAALVQVPTACMALVHQLSQLMYAPSRFGVTDLFKLLHTCRFTVHMLGTLVQLKVCH